MVDVAGVLGGCLALGAFCLLGQRKVHSGGRAGVTAAGTGW